MKNILFLLMTILGTSSAFSQVGINTPTPDESAVLDISSSDKGVLFPRMDLGDLTVADPVVNPEESLVVWNTDAANGGAAKGFYYWDDMWKPFGSAANSNNELSGVFGKLTLDSNLSINLRRYNNTSINGSSSGTSSGTSLNKGQFTIRPEVDGRYQVIYTVSYKKDNNSGADEIEFYFSENTNAINESKKTGSLSTSKTTVTNTIELDLRANQTYGIGFSRSNEAPNNVPLTIFADLTEFSIQRL
ncbi:hypothetical protein LX97_02050 [Nonlabens dokdonensis]|jgi:hypothetical protein|uniref:Hep_Hag family protein n=2 Tax=Nonlabens dokdonensis TaxID=328515 RepID=L7WCX1_NONDD|nr:hypothetical protein [Nonlabens dokdonensis]AGC77771.1 Hep_Hag family protein [Nonlabens dokdonensis DSW-6]PZX39696.1 hypothetical protein LX97_02050 [Nonlabens dokdonensis]